jgi:ribosomal protein S18 acetylase RimI-like enzyme
MISVLLPSERDKIERILIDTNNFNDDEIRVAMELVDDFITNKEQKDYMIYADKDDGSGEINGYICIGPRPLTKGTYDLYWIAVNPKIQSKGVGSRLIKYCEDKLKEEKGRLMLIETSGKPSYEKERKFYEKNNYIKFVEIKDFYNTDDSLVIYGKYL